jgi:hypothetical protein
MHYPLNLTLSHVRPSKKKKKEKMKKKKKLSCSGRKKTPSFAVMCGKIFLSLYSLV